MNHSRFLPLALILCGLALVFLMSCGTPSPTVLLDRAATLKGTADAVATAVSANSTKTAVGVDESYAATRTAAAFPPSATTVLTFSGRTTTPATSKATVTIASATLSATLTPSMPPSPATPGSAVISFSVVPTTTHALGDIVQARWQVRAGQVSLCPYLMTPQGPVEVGGECSDAALQGERSITITEKDLGWSGLLLRVTNAQTTERSLVPLTLGCQGFRDWFFTPALAKCPETVAIHSRAAAQSFEHGMMVWLKQPDRFYVFYDSDKSSGTFEGVNAPYTVVPRTPPGGLAAETPPPGLFVPVSGFGQVWRAEIIGLESTRSRLGWATAPEFAFDTSYQCEVPNPAFRLWTCYLRRPDGKVLRLRPDSTAQVHFLWEVQ